LKGFYAIVDVPPDALADLDALARRSAALLESRPACLQLRAKVAAARPLAEAASRLLALCRAAGVPFCVNDRMDVALAVGADVVHLGQDDLPLPDAVRVRERLGRSELVIGFSTHNLAQAQAAAAGGADYIGFGPVFGTASKLNPDPIVGLAALATVTRAVQVPVVAIGGIGLDTVGAVAAAGASAAALIGAVERASDPAAVGRAVAAAFAR
jgi:thiamine-phosphate pyrophosphorylase